MVFSGCIAYFDSSYTVYEGSRSQESAQVLDRLLPRTLQPEQCSVRKSELAATGAAARAQVGSTRFRPSTPRKGHHGHLTSPDPHVFSLLESAYF